MIELQTCSAHDLAQFGQKMLGQIRHSKGSFEAAAQFMSHQLYSTMVDACGEPALGLVRIFRIGPYADLPPSLQVQADPSVDYWMSLMGTYGLEPAWRLRQQSHSHQVFPAQAAFTPMLKAAFAQMQLTPGALPTAEDMNLAPQSSGAFKRYFHIEQALGHPSLPAQETFVRPYHIRSVFGLGLPFLNGKSYLLLLFSRVPLGPADSLKLTELAPYVSTALAIFEAQAAIWEAQDY